MTSSCNGGELEYLDDLLKENNSAAWNYVKRHAINPAAIMKERKRRIQELQFKH